MSRPQHEDVDLEFPAVIDGEEHSKVRIRRLTGREVDRFTKGEAPLSMVTTLTGRTIAADELLDLFDDDDLLRIDDAINRFFPERLRVLARSVSQRPASSQASSPENSEAASTAPSTVTGTTSATSQA